MYETMINVLPHKVVAFGLLLMLCSIVVIEAVRSSREALWGDIFQDDLDD